MDKSFVDRKVIKNQIINDIKDLNIHKKVLILYAGQGIGKSALTEEITKKVDSHLTFRVSTNFCSNRKVSKGVHYKSFVENTIALKLEGKLPSLIDYFKSKPKETLKKISLGAIKAFSKFDPISKKLVSFAENVSDFTDRELGMLMSSPYLEGQIQFSSYLIDSIKNKQVLIIVENAHSIDDEFINFLRMIIKKTRTIYCILEYTKNVNSIENEEDLLNEFSGVAKHRESIELMRLPTNYALEIVSSKDVDSLEVIGRYYNDSDGNLKPLNQMANYRGKVLSSTLQSISKSKYGIESVTVNEFNLLNDDEKLILALIITSDGSFPLSLLQIAASHSLGKMDSRQLRHCLNTLEKKDFIKICSGSVNTADDVSFRIVGSSDFLGKYDVLALRIWKKVYDDSNKNSLDLASNEITLRRLKILCRLEDKASLLAMIKEVLFYAKHSLSPIIYLQPLADWIIKEKTSPAWCLVMNEILNAAIRFGLLELSHSLLKCIEFTKYWDINNELKLSLILLKMNMPTKALKKINQLFEMEADYINKETQMLFEIVALTAHYYLSKFSESSKIYYSLRKDTSQNDHAAYAFLLRCSPMFNSINKSIIDLSEAIRIFSEKKMHLSLARTKIKLSIALAKTEHIEKSKMYFNEAKKELINRNTDHNIVINNQEALKLHEKIVDPELFSNLEELLLIYTKPYEVAVITTNLMLASVMINDDKTAIQYANEVIELVKTNPNLDVGMYWTIKKNMEYTEIALGYNKGYLSQKIPKFVLTKLRKHKLLAAISKFPKKIKCKYELHFARMTYRPMYLAYWAIEFD
ncbi:MAG: hypothetical protein JKY19_09000 [Alcanivoracaceae bacterium]|nr:hypothetical protein [Alcanivoracaceae bacterium]